MAILQQNSEPSKITNVFYFENIKEEQEVMIC